MMSAVQNRGDIHYFRHVTETFNISSNLPAILENLRQISEILILRRDCPLAQNIFFRCVNEWMDLFIYFCAKHMPANETTLKKT